jgi:F-type H+-transporting ATPase subunit gamma
VANLKEVRTRIASVKSTQQITSAMKLVSASKLRRAQMAIQSLRPYASKMQEIMANLSDTMENMEEAAYSQKRNVERVLLVVVTSNKGLCGPFNSNIVKATLKQLNETYREQHQKGNVELYCIGKKGSEYFTKRKYNVYKSDIELFNQLTFENSSAIAVELADLYADKKYDKIEIIYNQFKNAAVQMLQKEQFLPVEVTQVDVKEEQQQHDYIFEPNKEEIIRELLPKTLRTQFFKTLLDSFASEHGARMTAMQLATDNANEIVKDLQLAYNKARQAAITSELIEIVSGAEALKG